MAARVFETKTASRDDGVGTPLLIGLIGASGSGKTFSGLELLTGIQEVCGGDIHVIETEAKRSLAYSHLFRFQRTPLVAPYGSLDYLDAIEHVIKLGGKNILIDQMSSEHDGPGGMMDFYENELDRMAGTDWEKRERVKMLAWGKPKAARRRLINSILQMDCNFIFNFRAKHISKPTKNDKDKTVVVDQGFVPIAGEDFVFEMAACMLLYPQSDGVPTWKSDFPGERLAMKLPLQFRGILDRGEPLSRRIGVELANWSMGVERQLTPKEVVAKYDACSDAEMFNVVETRRSQIWEKSGTESRKQMKAASDRCTKRLNMPMRAAATAASRPRYIVGTDDPDAACEPCGGVGEGCKVCNGTGWK